MTIDNPFLGIEFANQPRMDSDVNNKIAGLVSSLTERGEQAHPLIGEYFKDPDFFHSLPEEIRCDNQKLAELLLNMSKFCDFIAPERQKRGRGDVSGLLGEEVHIAESSHSDGRKRRAESGEKINVDFVRSQGIDPSKVLFFRITQPTDQPKPEYYWTSDYFETQRGLTREIPQDQRKNAIILVASLNVIDTNGGLIQDRNDDSGLAVRQIGTDNFDQHLALTKITSDSPR